MGTMRPAVWCAQGRGARMPVPGAGSEKATSTSQVRVASAILFITVGLAALGLVLLPQDRWLTLESVGQVAGNGLFMLACSAVGILIVARRPGNVIGWIYLLVPLVHGRLRGCRWLRWPLAARFQVGGAAPRPPVDSHCPRGRNAVDAAVSHRPPAVTALAADGLGHGGCHRGGRGRHGADARPGGVLPGPPEPARACWCRPSTDVGTAVKVQHPHERHDGDGLDGRG